MSSVLLEILEKRSVLVARRRELKGELTWLAADISAIDRVTRMLHPDHPSKADPSRRQAASGLYPRGELAVAALETLRRIGRPATSAECGAAILEAKGRTDDPDLLGQVVNRVSAIFSQKAEAGQVRRAGNGEGRQLLWKTRRRPGPEWRVRSGSRNSYGRCATSALAPPALSFLQRHWILLRRFGQRFYTGIGKAEFPRAQA